MPGSLAVAQVAHATPPPPPPGAPRRKFIAIGGPPTRYLVEFVISRYVYFGWTEGPPSDQTKFVKIAKDYYDRVKGYRG